MFSYLRKIFQRFSEINSEDAFSDPDSLENNVFQLAIWNQFDQRTNEYESASKRHGVTHQRLLNWIGSIDYSGYTREKCLRALIDHYQLGDENRILLRLADWVPTIATHATKWTLENFQRLSIESIRANQNLLLYLSRKQNLDTSAAMIEIKRDLLNRCHSLTKEEFFLFHSMFRRFLYAWSFVKSGQLRTWMIDDPDPFNRLYLLNSVSFHNLSDDEIKKLKQDSSLFVRRSFFYAQLKVDTIPPKDELLSMAFSTHRSIRMLGQFYLQKLYHIDAHALYLNATGEEFYYIADYAKADNWQYFVTGISSGSKESSYQCLRALTSAMPEELANLDLKSLLQKNRKTRSLILAQLPNLLNAEEIIALRELIIGNEEKRIFSYLFLLEKKSFWAFIDECLSIMLEDARYSMREQMKQHIRKKASINETLSSARRKSIEQKINQMKVAQPKEARFLETLEFIMR